MSNDFMIQRPVPSKTQAVPWENISLIVPITSKLSSTVSAFIKIIIYEGSIWPGHGTKIVDYSGWLTFAPYQTHNVFTWHLTVEGTIDRRDVGVEVYVNNILNTSAEFDDVFFVEAEPVPDLKVLAFEILGEKAGGFIAFKPPPIDFEGHYIKGTVVNLTALVNPGFAFIMWRGEVDNPLSTSLYNTVTMSENRLVKAEFGLAEVEKFWPLEVDIEPQAGGYVTTSPPPADITNHFTDGTIGKFLEDTRVKVTAHPNAGYEFLKWSDEIQGGVSYNPTEWVSGVMDEHKAVKAHFREVEIPPECAIDADCPIGYVCQNGVCVLEKPPPDDEEPPEKKEFPWLPVALIGGGALVAIVATRPKKTKS